MDELDILADEMLKAGWPPAKVQALHDATAKINQLQLHLGREQRLANHLARALNTVGRGCNYWPLETRGSESRLDAAMQHYYDERPRERNPLSTGEIPVVERPHTELGWGYGDR